MNFKKKMLLGAGGILASSIVVGVAIACNPVEENQSNTNDLAKSYFDDNFELTLNSTVDKSKAATTYFVTDTSASATMQMIIKYFTTTSLSDEYKSDYMLSYVISEVSATSVTIETKFSQRGSSTVLSSKSFVFTDFNKTYTAQESYTVAAKQIFDQFNKTLKNTTLLTSQSASQTFPVGITSAQIKELIALPEVEDFLRVVSTFTLLSTTQNSARFNVVFSAQGYTNQESTFTITGFTSETTLSNNKDREALASVVAQFKAANITLSDASLFNKPASSTFATTNNSEQIFSKLNTSAQTWKQTRISDVSATVTSISGDGTEVNLNFTFKAVSLTESVSLTIKGFKSNADYARELETPNLLKAYELLNTDTVFSLTADQYAQQSSSVFSNGDSTSEIKNKFTINDPSNLLENVKYELRVKVADGSVTLEATLYYSDGGIYNTWSHTFTGFLNASEADKQADAKALSDYLASLSTTAKTTEFTNVTPSNATFTNSNFKNLDGINFTNTLGVSFGFDSVESVNDESATLVLVISAQYKSATQTFKITVSNFLTTAQAQANELDAAKTLLEASTITLKNTGAYEDYRYLLINDTTTDADILALLNIDYSDAKFKYISFEISDKVLSDTAVKFNLTYKLNNTTLSGVVAVNLHTFKSYDEYIKSVQSQVQASIIENKTNLIKTGDFQKSASAIFTTTQDDATIKNLINVSSISLENQLINFAVKSVNDTSVTFAITLSAANSDVTTAFDLTIDGFNLSAIEDQKLSAARAYLDASGTFEIDATVLAKTVSESFQVGMSSNQIITLLNLDTDASALNNVSYNFEILAGGIGDDSVTVTSNIYNSNGSLFDSKTYVFQGFMTSAELQAEQNLKDVQSVYEQLKDAKGTTTTHTEELPSASFYDANSSTWQEIKNVTWHNYFNVEVKFVSVTNVDTSTGVLFINFQLIKGEAIQDWKLEVDGFLNQSQFDQRELTRAVTFLGNVTLADTSKFESRRADVIANDATNDQILALLNIDFNSDVLKNITLTIEDKVMTNSTVTFNLKVAVKNTNLSKTIPVSLEFNSENQALTKASKEAYNLTESAAIEHLGIKLYAPFLTKENLEYYFNIDKGTFAYDYEIVDTRINLDNFNELIVELRIKDNESEDTYTFEKTFTITNDIKAYIDGITSTNFDTYFTYDSSIKTDKYASDVFTLEKINSYFTTKTNRYFTYKISSVSASEDSDTATVTVDVYLRNQKLKSITGVKSTGWLTTSIYDFVKTVPTEYYKSIVATAKTELASANDDHYGDSYLTFYYALLQTFKSKGGQWAELANKVTKLSLFKNMLSSLRDDFTKLLKSQYQLTIANDFDLVADYIQETVAKLVTVETTGGYSTIQNSRYPYFGTSWTTTKNPLNTDQYRLFIPTYNNDSVLYPINVINPLGRQQNVIIDVNSSGTQYAKNSVLVASAFTNKTLSLELITTAKTNNDIYAEDIVWSELYKIPSFGPIQVQVKTKSVNNYGRSAVYYFYLADQNGKEVIKSSDYTMNYFKAPQDPIDDGSFDDDYFTSRNNASDTVNGENIKKINGSNFALIQTATTKQYYLDPSLMTVQEMWGNLKYFFKFNGTIEATDENSSGSDFKDAKATGEGTDSLAGNSTEKATEVPQGEISTDKNNGVNINTIRNSYYFAYYDIKIVNNNTISFKLGFINKTNPDIRYHSNTIRLTNLTNTIADSVYPVQDLNNITYSDIQFSSANGAKDISRFTVSQFKEMITNGTTQSKELISIKASSQAKFTYKKYTQTNTETSYDDQKYLSQFSIADIKEESETSGFIFVRWQYVNRTTAVKSDNWMKITGFKPVLSGGKGNSNTEDKIFSNLKDTNSNLYQVAFGETNVMRSRVIELPQDVRGWVLSDDKTTVTQTIPAEYYEKIFTESNSRNASINFQMYAGINNTTPTFNTNYTSGKWKPISLTASWSKIKSAEGYSFQTKFGTTNKFYGTNGKLIEFDYIFTVKLINGNIVTQFKAVDPKYKITQDINTMIKENGAVNSTIGKVDNSKAIYFDKYGTIITYKYTNDVEIEDFETGKTNFFNYGNVTFTQENEPILIDSERNYTDSFAWNYNQNVKTKWSTGYKLDFEYMHNSNNSEVAQNLKARTWGGGFGSMSMLRKVSDDPSDYRFYVVTNNHVLNSTRDQDDDTISGSANTFVARYSNTYANMYYNGDSYWGGATYASVPYREIWDGNNQIKNNGEKNGFVDYTIVVFDIKGVIATAKAEGKWELAAWFENWMTLEPLEVNIDKDGLTYSNFTGKLNVDFGFNGAPYGKQATYIYHRTGINAYQMSFVGDGYSPIYHNAGNSGTGVLSNTGEYMAAINSGGPNSLLIAWKLYRSDVDYWGGSEAEKDVWTQKNTNSFIASLIRANAYDPVSFPLFDIDSETK